MLLARSGFRNCCILHYEGIFNLKRSVKGDFRSNFSELIYISVTGLNVINAAFAYIAAVEGDYMVVIPA